MASSIFSSFPAKAEPIACATTIATISFTTLPKSSGFSRTVGPEGVCAGDYDDDGFTDLFVTYWVANHLYRNIGGKANFDDVTLDAGLGRNTR